METNQSQVSPRTVVAGEGGQERGPVGLDAEWHGRTVWVHLNNHIYGKTLCHKMGGILFDFLFSQIMLYINV